MVDWHKPAIRFVNVLATLTAGIISVGITARVWVGKWTCCCSVPW